MPIEMSILHILLAKQTFVGFYSSSGWIHPPNRLHIFCAHTLTIIIIISICQHKSFSALQYVRLNFLDNVATLKKMILRYAKLSFQEYKIICKDAAKIEKCCDDASPWRNQAAGC